MIYLNCAATSYKRPECVVAAVSDALRMFGSMGRGATSIELGAARTIAEAREQIASLLGFSCPGRVIFAANATMALNTAIMGVVRPGDHVVATDWDHNSVLRPLNRLVKHENVRVSYVPADSRGVLDDEKLERLITPDTRLVICTHASNLTGNIADIERFIHAAHQVGALFLLDAAQTAGSLPIDIEALGVDLFAFTGHKALMGPQGTGGLLVAPHVEVDAVLCGGTGVLSFEPGMPASYPEHLEAGTLNSHGLAGLLAAVRFISKEGVSAIHAHNLSLTRRFVAGLRNINGTTIYGDFPDDLAQMKGGSPRFDHAAVVSLNLSGWNSSQLADVLSEDFGIAVRSGGHCAPRMHRALGTEKTGAVRFSFGYYTTEEEIDCALEALEQLSKGACDA